MANTKQVEIEGRVPFCWLDSYNAKFAPNGQSEEDQALLGRLLLSPSGGLKIGYTNDGYDGPNEYGGHTSMYLVKVWGREAVWMEVLHTIRAMIAKAGVVTKARVKDLDDPHGWEEF